MGKPLEALERLAYSLQDFRDFVELRDPLLAGRAGASDDQQRMIFGRPLVHGFETRLAVRGSSSDASSAVVVRHCAQFSVSLLV